jgi:uncharacterized membrane protein
MATLVQFPDPVKEKAMSNSRRNMTVWNEKHLRAATDAVGVALWAWNVDTDAITMDERAYDLWEISQDEKKVTFESLSKNIHPADLERVRSAFAATRATIGAYEMLDPRGIALRYRNHREMIFLRLVDFGTLLPTLNGERFANGRNFMSQKITTSLAIAAALSSALAAAAVSTPAKAGAKEKLLRRVAEGPERLRRRRRHHLCRDRQGRLSGNAWRLVDQGTCVTTQTPFGPGSLSAIKRPS